jgi:hypothetical protein
MVRRSNRHGYRTEDRGLGGHIDQGRVEPQDTRRHLKTTQILIWTRSNSEETTHRIWTQYQKDRGAERRVQTRAGEAQDHSATVGP